MILNRKQLCIIGGSALGALLLAVLLVFLVRGCRKEETPMPSGDREADYQAFLNATFDSVEEARGAAAAWMGRFIAVGDEERIAETQAILDCFLQMQEFFAREYPSERSFRSQMSFMGKRFEDSPYPVVRNSWQRISYCR